MPESNPYRLPRTVVPSHYRLTLEPDLDKARFGGEVIADIEVLEPVTEVVLNALELEIDEARLDRAGETLKAKVSLDEQTARCHLALDGEAEPGRWSLTCRFRGVLNDKLEGFYRSTLTDAEGAERPLATTQMEATHARQAFPCWDEPDLKATFEVSLVVPEGLLALSNGAEISREPAGGGKARISYAPTMRMSTYLVAFVVGPLLITDPVDADGTPLRVAYPPGRDGLTGFALESGAFALRYFSEYYGIGYPDSKLDLVAIPDFASGAMENLGCITFRETALLVDPDRATQPELQRVADVVHHEIAHMWFGDLVTMRWWNGLWLNEAFATFMEMKCTDEFRPEWERWVDFGISRTAAFAVDSLESTRPIEFEVVSPKDSAGMFDVLTYEKGAAVLRMLEQYLGEETFRDGVRHYLGKHAYGNTDTTDLWDSLEAVADQPVRRIMDGWIFTGGYPLISAELAGGEAPELRLSQRRFSYREGDSGDAGYREGDSGDAGYREGDSGDAGDGPVWAVPVLIRYAAGGRERMEKLLLDGTQTAFPLMFVPDWLVVNAGATGFFRVAYTQPMLDGLLGAGLGSLSASERYSLVDDGWAGLVAGKLTSPQVLDLLRRLSTETDLAVWQRIYLALRSLDRLLDEPARPAFQAVVRDLVGPALERLGTDPVAGEDTRTAQLRGTLVETLGSVGADEDIRVLCRKIHTDFVDDPSSADPALAAAAVGVIADGGGDADFEAFWQRHKSADSPQEAVRYLLALGRFPDAELTQRLLDRVLDEVRTQDAPLALLRALGNRDTGRLVWDFIAANWETLGERLPSNMIVRMVGAISGITVRSWAAEVDAFFEHHTVPQGEKTLAQNIERMHNNVRLRERESDRLKAHLGGR